MISQLIVLDIAIALINVAIAFGFEVYLAHKAAIENSDNDLNDLSSA